MQEIQKKFEVVEGLKKSKVFAKQELYLKILDYLIKAEQNKQEVKSTTIAIDLLSSKDKKEKTKVQDSLIRNKVSKLRKELDMYYLTEGKNNNLQISIPKGEYRVNLIDTNEKMATKKYSSYQVNSKIKVLWGVIAFLSIVLSLSLYIQFFSSPHSHQKRSLVSYLIDTNKPIDIVVGSRGFYSEYDPSLDRFRFIFDEDVDIPRNRFKLDQIKLKNPKRIILDTEFIFRHADVGNLIYAAEIHREWGLLNQNSRILESTAIDQTSQISRNTIFISKMGSGDMYGLADLFNETRFVFEKGYLNRPLRITHFIKNDGTLLAFEKEQIHDAPKYFLFKKVFTPEGHSVLFLLPSAADAREYVFENTKNQNFISDVLKSMGTFDINREFELLFEIHEKASYKILYNSLKE